jgi:pimeloyl-ACP methyl ester carboxylesterase
MDVTVQGHGPAVLLPISIAAVEGAAADELRAWGADPDAGRSLAAGLVEAGFQVIAADYEKELTDHPRARSLAAGPLNAGPLNAGPLDAGPLAAGSFHAGSIDAGPLVGGSLDADSLAADLLAVADQAGVDRFAFYGYSWLALAGLQLALRTDRLTALAMGGYPPLGGPYRAMLEVTLAAHREALKGEAPPEHVEPGDWDSAGISRTPAQTGQYVNLYESLQIFDERAALSRVRIPRLAFAGEDDNIDYGPKWGNTRVTIGEPLREHAAELAEHGWTVRLIPGADHLKAMHAAVVLPILVPFLRDALMEPLQG